MLPELKRLWGELDSRNCYSRRDTGSGEYLVCTCGEVGEILDKMRTILTGGTFGG